jgi:hypothetical protein
VVAGRAGTILHGTIRSADVHGPGAVRDDARRRASAGAVRIRNDGVWGWLSAYDLAPDGRFLIIRSGQAEAGVGTEPQIVVVQNWFEELKRLVPVN